VNFFAASPQNKWFVAVQQKPYLGWRDRGANPLLARTSQKEARMARIELHEEFLPLEERIRRAGAERHVEMGYAIGDALAKISHGIASVFHRTGKPANVRPVGERLAAGD
jgi:hypothetical protein